ncbi:MAG: hydrogenase expression/formation protein HypE [Candidatus Latescibacteria bacterium]|nr:hydrogenase expression/formation protein HypE [Candidatus Latescibacterota bacterium]
MSGGLSLSCPLPPSRYDQVLLAHGGGGTLMARLLAEVFFPAFANPLLEEEHDGALLTLPNGTRLAFSTDSYVVQPLFFPGGDIGSLAVNGTINDLAMCGAQPLCLSAGFIVEEGLPMEILQRIAASMAAAAQAAGVPIATGDTKVVDRGKGDGLFINTAGIGLVEHGLHIAPRAVRPGDAVLLSGDLGRHGIAIMAQRQGLQFETTIQSDCAPLNGPVQALLARGIEIHCLRDLTRGGLASALVEIALKAGVHIEISEEELPVQEEVRGACEILGLDPLYVANEGRFAAFVPADQAGYALELLRAHPQSQGACRIGTAQEGRGQVTLKSRLGVPRVVDRLSGEQLPRIC